MITVVVILAVGAGSYLFRVLPILFGTPASSPRAERTIAHAGTAALAALIASGIHRDSTGADLGATIAAATVALVVALRTASMARVLFAGGATYALCLLAMAALT